MKKLLYITLPAIVSLCLCVACNPDAPTSYKPIVLQEGCYMAADSSCVVIFPRDQHAAADGSYAATYMQKDEYGSYQATIPFRLSNYSDSLGLANIMINDSAVAFLTDGASSVALIYGGDTLRFTKQKAVDYSPRSVKGNWVMSFALNAYMSFKLLDMSVTDDLQAEIHLNLNEEMLDMLLSMAGMMAGDETGDMIDQMSGEINWSEFLQYVPSNFPGTIWYSMDAGMGVFVPDLKAVAQEMDNPEINESDIPEVAICYMTPNESTIRISIAGYPIDLSRQ